MATTLFDNVRRNYAATNQTRYSNSYRRRFMDKTILGDICNSNPDNIKSFLGVGKGSKVEMYVPTNVKVRETKPDGGIIYQQMTDSTVTFGLNHECYWAVQYRPEDKRFMPFNPMSDTLANATDMVARHQEIAFGAHIPLCVPAFNQGANAGVKFRAFDLGTTVNPVMLFKTQTQVDDAAKAAVAASNDFHGDVAADFMLKMANTLRQGEGLSGYHVNIVIDSVIRHQLQTSELKYEGVMGRNAALGSDKRGGRSEVKFLGTMDDTIGVIQDDIMFQALQQEAVAATGERNLHPVFALMTDACAFINETLLRDDAMKDVGNWNEHYRAKQVYDFPVMYPQMLALGWVKVMDHV